MRNVQKNEGLSGTKAPSFTERLDARARAHNTGVDLLRILCMFGIVAMHTVSPGWGGVFETAQPGSIQFAICALIRAVGMSALDAFALISGFVAYSEKKKPVRITGILHLYLQVLTYGLLVALVFRLVRPELVSVRHFVTPFFPITGNLYWYYTAYVGMFVVSPLLNAAIRYTPKRTLRVVLLAMFAAFSVYTAVCDSFKILEGYSTIWLILLYVMGGILKKCEIGRKLRPWAAFAGFAVLTGITCLWKLYGLQVDLFGVTIDRDVLSTFTSPTVLGASLLCVIGFYKLRFKKFMTRLAAFASPCVFAVYLLNAHDLIHDNLIEGRFACLGTASPLTLIGTILAFAAGFVAASILIDRVRLLAFDLLHIPQLLSALDRAAHKLVQKRIPND